MKQSSRKTVLVVAGTLLVLLTVLSLVALRGPENAPDPQPDGPRVVHRPSTSAAPLPAPPRRAEPAPAGPDAGALPRVVAAPEAGPPAAESEQPQAPPPPRAHAVAPAAVPPEIEDEADPQRRAELMKMHKLATARVRAGMLRRRARMLQDTLREAQKSGEWTAERMAQTQQDLEQLRQAVQGAQKELQQLTEELQSGPPGERPPRATPLTP